MECLYWMTLSTCRQERSAAFPELRTKRVPQFVRSTNYYPVLLFQVSMTPTEKKSPFQSECMKNDFLHWLKGYLLWDLSLLFTYVIAMSLIAIISYAISVDARCIPLIFMHMHIFFHLERRAVYSLTLINIFFHRRNFLHRLSAVIMGLETKCLCTAGIFRNCI